VANATVAHIGEAILYFAYPPGMRGVIGGLRRRIVGVIKWSALAQRP
jgi:hypothetical protein